MREIEIQTLLMPGMRPPDAPELAPVRPGPAAAGDAPVTLTAALASAGLRLVDAPPVALHVDGSDADAGWSEAELLAALDALRSPAAAVAGQPRPLQLLIATRSARPGVLGVMFRTPMPEAGPAAAVFHDAILDHPKVGGDPAAFAREYLFTCVHEIGHLMGLPHAWEPFAGVGGPARGRGALSFMNYPHLYSRGYRQFYRRFGFRYRDEEAAHLAGTPWADIWRAGVGDGAGGALLAGPTPEPFAGAERLRLTLKLHRAPRFAFGEPVQIEVKLENLSRRRVLVPADLLDAEGGRLRVYVRGPAAAPARVLEPLCLREQRAQNEYLAPRIPRRERRVPDAGAADRSLDTRYAMLDLTVGRDGFLFTRPGRYEVWVEARLLDDRRLRSEPLRFTVDAPSRPAERFAGKLFTPRMATAFALGADPGSDEFALLGELTERAELRAMAPSAAARIGATLAGPFRRVGGRTEPARPREAARWLARAAAPGDGIRPLPPIVRGALLELRSRCLARAGRAQRAEGTLDELREVIEAAVRDNGRLRERLLARVRRLRRELRSGEHD